MCVVQEDVTVRSVGEICREYLELMERGQAAARMREVEHELRGRRVQISCDWYQDGRNADGVVVGVAATGVWVSTPFGAVEVDPSRLQESVAGTGAGVMG